MAEAVERIEPEQRRQQEVEIPIAEAERQIGENAVGAHPASDEFEPADRKEIGERAAEYGRAARRDGGDPRARREIGGSLAAARQLERDVRRRQRPARHRRTHQDMQSTEPAQWTNIATELRRARPRRAPQDMKGSP